MSSSPAHRGTRPPASRHPRTGRQADAARRISARSAVQLPAIVYPEQLPVSARRSEIARAIESHQVVIVAGETGSGKTTQLPKIALELGRGRTGQIGHTQPRRIAARTVAERIASELGITLGDVVGYQVRFTDTSSDSTLVKVMTDGILLAQIQRDPMLWAYDTLIIDEAHERSLNIDFILGYLTRLIPQRPDLKVIITSATIDSQRFAEHFHNADGVPAPIIEVTGRTYPVEVRYRPAEDSGAEDQPSAICLAVSELMAAGPGDILVFCSGEREIRDAADALTDAFSDRIVAGAKGGANALEILPLFARLSAAEQHRVFASHPGRRIVLATNVAETSLTVPGIRYVVDPGTARISRYSKATKVQRLPIEPISQASANQRAGRCGRVADGICIRLYSAEDFESRPEFTEPEILRTSLASVILHMVSSGVAKSPQDVASFPFVDPPDARNVRDGVNLLLELAALSAEPGRPTHLTDIGRQLAQLPIDPRLGRMVIEAVRTGAAREVIIIAAALSIQDPRERPVEERERADQLHRRFADPRSDFLTYLNLWEYLRRMRKQLSGNAFRRRCRSEYINYLRVREWQDVVTQLRQLAREIGLSVTGSARIKSADDGASGPDAAPTSPDAANPTSANPTAGQLRREWDADAIHHALLAGLLSQLGMLQVTDVKANGATKRPRRSTGPAEYLGARGAKFAIFPGSVLAKKPPAWIMAGELVETGRLWARQVAQVQPEWAESLAAHLTKRTYSEPRWSAKRGAAIVDERVLLYGVPIVAARPVLLGKSDPEAARELFIRHALVAGEWRTHHRFFAHNRDLLAAAEETENRLRRRGLVIDDEALVQFYDERLPATIVSARHFDTWWKKTRQTQPDLLTYSADMVLREHADPTLFPDHWSVQGMSLDLAYEFDPTSQTDGVRVAIPISVLNQVMAGGFDWQVPGLRTELVAALIRTLPKPLRTRLVPAPDTARNLIDRLNQHPGNPQLTEGEPVPITRALGDVIFDDRGLDVPDDAWDTSRLPAHVRMTFEVLGDDGALLARGKELAVLRSELAGELQTSLTQTLAAAAQVELEVDDRPAPVEVAAKPGDHLPKLPATWTLDRATVSDWDFGDLPDQVEQVGSAGLPVRGYPALVDGGDGVALRVLPSLPAARAAMPAGVCRLLLGQVGLSTARITSRLNPGEKLPLATSAYPSVDALVADCQLAALAEIAREGGPLPRNAEDYRRLREVARDALEDRVYRVVQQVADILAAARELDREVSAVTSMSVLTSVHDIGTHLGKLLSAGFVWRAGVGRLADVRRYVAAEAYRVQRLGQNSAREASSMWQLGQVREAYDDALAALPPGTPVPGELAEVEWMLEEFRVSLFAQQLGTAYPVSEKRIRKAIAAAFDAD